MICEGFDMDKLWRCFAVVGVVAGVCLLLSACGGSSGSSADTASGGAAGTTNGGKPEQGQAPADSPGTSGQGQAFGQSLGGKPVIRVAGSGSLTEGTVDHWVKVEEATNFESNPKHPIPAGAVADPPSFKQCIAWMRSYPPELVAKRRREPAARLKKECETNHRAVRAHTISVLISFLWFEAEAAKKGITFAESVVRKELERFWPGVFKTREEFKNSLIYAGETYADELQRMKIDLISQALEDRAAKAAGVSGEQKLRAYGLSLRSVTDEWVRKTSCSSGFVAPNCREYKGAEPPEFRI